jgi:hypothetical protein
LNPSFQPDNYPAPDSISITVNPLDGNYNLVKQTCKRIIFSIVLPKFVQPIKFNVENLGFDSKKFVHWCGFFVKKVSI